MYVNTNVMKSENTVYSNNKRLEIIPRILQWWICWENVQK